MSNSTRPHREQPTRLPCPWDSPGKNTGVVVISFSNAWKWKMKGKSFSHIQLFTTPWTTAYEAPLSMGFSRQEYWSGVPSPSPYYNIQSPKYYCWSFSLSSDFLLPSILLVSLQPHWLSCSSHAHWACSCLMTLHQPLSLSGKLFLQNKMREVPPSVVSMVLPPLSLTKL